ncbi:hypothetical protein [Zobellia uliginosa]|uniref:hypothetical protein n=1 Tax=Zobellia uliginosa TaxID=143224 RepID=UPI001C0651C0|nr:hypothetical protein [Zobellia uliginosa]MBU2948054.1 hypothetical protein [Zobellia uliginosa]
MEKSKIVKMGYTIQQFLVDQKLNDAKPKDLMDVLIKRSYFDNDQKEGQPLRNILRQLDDENILYLLPQVRVERKDINRFSFFNAVKF